MAREEGIFATETPRARRLTARHRTCDVASPQSHDRIIRGVDEGRGEEGERKRPVAELGVGVVGAFGVGNWAGRPYGGAWW